MNNGIKLKQEHFPIFISIEEDGIASIGEQTYKLVIQTSDLQFYKFITNDINYLIKTIPDNLTKLINLENNDSLRRTD